MDLVAMAKKEMTKKAVHAVMNARKSEKRKKKLELKKKIKRRRMIRRVKRLSVLTATVVSVHLLKKNSKKIRQEVKLLAHRGIEAAKSAKEDHPVSVDEAGTISIK